MNIQFSTMDIMHKEMREDMIQAFANVYDKGWYISGEECDLFEKEFADFCKVKFCVGCSNGLDAIHLMLLSAGIGDGDEVIVPSNTFIATALAVSYSGATPVLVEPNLNSYVLEAKEIEKKITKKTKAVIVVDLYGQMADMEPIANLCKKNGILLFEDAAQAHGATYKSKNIGYYSDGATFSFYPGKNLGALGDAGAFITNNKILADKFRELSNYGSSSKYIHDSIGYNNRLDELQAAFLRIKLKSLNKITEERQRIANKYLENINNNKIILPVVESDRTHVWHIFSIRTENKNNLKEYLSKHGISTGEHYPIAICDQTAYKNNDFGDLPISRTIAKQQLSLPLYFGMTDLEIEYVIQKINNY